MSTNIIKDYTIAINCIIIQIVFPCEHLQFTHFFTEKNLKLLLKKNWLIYPVKKENLGLIIKLKYKLMDYS